MAQHDYNIANQSGADFRADLNNALSAIATVNSGASEPSTTFSHQLWVDTSNNVLKIRNAANSAFITTGVSITASNTFTGKLTGNVTGDLTGNADTATTLATARTINGVSFNGSANISFNTDSVAEGSSNLYFTNERVDDQVNALLQAGTGIQLTYDDTAGTLTIANTNDADITGVVAGNGLTGGGTSGSVTLNVAVDDSSIEIDSDALRVKASGITNTMLAGSIANSKLANSSVTINSQSLALGGSLDLDTSEITENTNLYYTNERVDDRVSTLIQNGTGISWSYDDTAGTFTPTISLSPFNTSQLSESGNLYFTDARARAAIREDSTQLSYNSGTCVLTYTQGDTDTVSEGSNNLYYTSARANTDFDTRLATKSTSNLAEGTNLYYTTARFDSAFTSKDTDDLSEGTTNLYYTQSRFDSAFGNKTTANLTENTNLYYTDTRANSAIDARVVKSFVDALGIQATSVADNSVVLGNDTTGNYIQTITGTANKITVSGSGSESADVTLTLPDDVQIASDLTVAGNLTVNGTLTSLDTTNLDIEDNLFQLNAGLTGSPVNDSGMLINRGNADNGIFMWDESFDKFTLGLTTADGSATGNITLSSLGTLVANLEGSVTGNITGQVSDISNFTTANLTENTNLYYTQARFDTAFGNKSTTNLSEGTNLYYTDARVQAVSINNVVEDTTPQLGGTLDLNSSDITGTGDINITGTITSSGNITGTLATASQPNITSVGTLTGLTTTGDINLGDNDKAIFGAGSDLEIYHDGSTSYILDDGVGDLQLRSNNRIVIAKSPFEYMADFNADGAVDLYYDNSKKLATTSTGIDVTGTITADGLAVDDITINGSTISDSGDFTLDVGGDIELNADGSTIVLKDNTLSRFTFNLDSTPSIQVQGTSLEIETVTGDADILFKGNDNGVDVTALTLDMSDAGKALFNAGANFGLGIDVTGVITQQTPANTDSILTVDSTSTNVSQRLNLSANGTIQTQLYDDASQTKLFAVTNKPLLLGTNNTTAITIDSSQNVGIGTDSLSAPLEVRCDSNNRGISIVEQGVGTETWKLGVNTDGDLIFLDSVDTTASVTFQDGTGNVGIGTDNPSTLLHLSAANDPIITLTDTGFGASADITGSNGNLRLNSQTATIFDMADGEVARIDSSGSLLVNSTSAGSNRLKVVGDASRYGILSENLSGYGAFNLKSTTVAQTWSIGAVDNSSNSDLFIYGGSSAGTKVTLDASGNLLVGTTDSATYNFTSGGGTAIWSNGLISSAKSGAIVGIFNRTSSDGDILQFRKDGSPVGSIGVVNGDRMVFATADGLGLQFDKDNNRIVPCDAAGAYNNNVELGDEGLAFTNLFLTGGIQFDSRSNKLDDYEEGEYTVTLTPTSGSITINSGRNTMKYTKVGRLVTITGRVNISSISSPTGGVSINLPFTSSNSNQSDSNYATFLVVTHDIDMSPNSKYIMAEVGDNSSTMLWREVMDSSQWPVYPATSLQGDGNEWFYLKGSFTTA